MLTPPKCFEQAGPLIQGFRVICRGCYVVNDGGTLGLVKGDSNRCRMVILSILQQGYFKDVLRNQKNKRTCQCHVGYCTFMLMTALWPQSKIACDDAECVRGLC